MIWALGIFTITLIGGHILFLEDRRDEKLRYKEMIASRDDQIAIWKKAAYDLGDVSRRQDQRIAELQDELVEATNLHLRDYRREGSRFVSNAKEFVEVFEDVCDESKDVAL